MWPQRLPVQVRSLTLRKIILKSRFGWISDRLFHRWPFSQEVKYGMKLAPETTLQALHPLFLASCFLFRKVLVGCAPPSPPYGVFLVPGVPAGHELLVLVAHRSLGL